MKTNGKSTSEFALLILSVTLVVGMVIAENALGWTIDASTKNVLMTLIGGQAVYAAGRTAYKISKNKTETKAN